MRRKILCIISVFISVAAVAQNENLTLDKAEQLIPRADMGPVKSLIPKIKEAVEDTLDTSDPRIKIVLNSNGTWAYLKDWSAGTPENIFSENWVENAVGAYNIPLDSLPDRVTLPLVDSISRFACPFTAKVYSPFGIRHRRRHQGVDLPLHVGDPVVAAFDGRVRTSMYCKGYGNVVIIRHGNGLETTYGHLSARKVETGAWVSAGDVVGLGGSTGRSTGPHLHFETRYDGYAFDPQWIIDFENAELRHAVFVLKRKYLSAYSKYVPESEEEEEEILAAEEKERAAVYHKVVSGDTLSHIAVKYHTTVSAICKLNKITTKTTLRLGRSLRVK